jgi:PAS domain S-box-containing protein
MGKQTENQTKIILDSIADGVFTVDSNLKVTSFNRSAEKITGIKKEEAIGRYCWEVFRASICEKRCALKHTMNTGHPVSNQSIYIVNLHGERIPVSISTALLRSEQDHVIGGVETFRDLSVVEELRKELTRRHSFQDIISKNKEMRRLFGILEQVSESDATVVCKNGMIGVKHLPDYFKNLDDSKAKRSLEGKPSSLGEMERSYIRETLKRNQWNRTATAAEMGIHPTTLWRKMKRLSVEPPEKVGPVSMQER